MPDHPPATTGPDLVRVTTCPCGEQHIISRTQWNAVQASVKGEPMIQRITVDGLGTWEVPTLWWALHWLGRLELPALAERYGWPKVEGNEDA